MYGTQAGPMYTGLGVARGGAHGGLGARQGFCGGCGHPRASCCCGCRECRKEAKDVLVEPTTTREGLAKDPNLAQAVSRMSAITAFASAEDTANVGEVSPIALRGGKLGLGSAFIGGGCCVHLSVEYTPSGTADGTVMILVQDSNDTMLAWSKKVSAGLGYQIKEGVVTTKPGAHLTVLAAGATARVRWCEVFSCC